MKKFLILAATAIIATTAQAKTWEYKASESEMGDKSYTASLDSEKVQGKKNASASLDIQLAGKDKVRLSVLFTENIGNCLDKCILDFRLDGEKKTTIFFFQVSNLPYFKINDDKLIQDILNAKEIKFRVTNVALGTQSSAYTFKQDDKFDPEKYKALKSK